MNAISRRLFLVVGLTSLAVAICAVGEAHASSSPPAPCTLLTRSEAQTLAGIKLEPAVATASSCTYNPYPTGPVAQVFIFVDSSLPITLQIDRKLHHTFRRLSGLGDQALEEPGYVFVRKGSVWITLKVLAPDLWPGPRRRLERAAAIAISRVKPAPRQTAALRRLTTVSHDSPAGGGRERWVGNERQYGGSITEYAGVVYQPDVVVVGGGANAIRAESPDGLTWTIDGNAPHAADLRVGKVMLATTFAAGRVLKLTRIGPDLRVVLGPVALTDVIRDGDFESSGPIPLTKPLLYKASLPTRAPKRRTQSAAATPSVSATPICCEGGMGVHIGYDNGAGRLSATVQLYVERPSVTFRIRIGGGHLLDASLQLHGAGGIRYDLWGATKSGSGNLRSGPVAVPGSFTIPLAGPLALTFTQSFDVSMQFSGEATVKTQGDYQLHGTVGFDTGGGAATRDPLGMETGTPITQNTLSLGVGVNAISLGWAIRATVGIGGGGFSAGAWTDLRSGLALEADGSNLMSLKLGCASAALDVTSRFGVGYTIPEFVRSVVNAVLGAAGAKPIAATGGPAWGPFTIWHPPLAQWCPPRQ
jgi:hypothetical protein